MKDKQQTFISFSRVSRAIASRWSSLPISNVVNPFVAIAVFNRDDFLQFVTLHINILCYYKRDNIEQEMIPSVFLRDYLEESVQYMDKILFGAVFEKLDQFLDRIFLQQGLFYFSVIIVMSQANSNGI